MQGIITRLLFVMGTESSVSMAWGAHLRGSDSGANRISIMAGLEPQSTRDAPNHHTCKTVAVTNTAATCPVPHRFPCVSHGVQVVTTHLPHILPSATALVVPTELVLFHTMSKTGRIEGAVERGEENARRTAAHVAPEAQRA